MDEKDVTITMTEKEWEQVFCALITFGQLAKVTRIRLPEKRQVALMNEWTKTQLLIKVLYKPRLTKTATEKIGRAIGDDWPTEASE